MDNNRTQNGQNRPRTDFSNSGGQSRGFDTPRETADSKFSELVFRPSWITEGADPSLVEYAESAGKFMAKNKLTNSKIRSIYGEIKRIQMGEFEKEKSSFYLLKPKVAYALGRDENNEGLKLFKKVFDKAADYVANQKSYENFCNFIEAVLAYHKAYGGKD